MSFALLKQKASLALRKARSVGNDMLTLPLMLRGRIIIRRPSRSDVLIFDRMGADMLHRTVLRGQDTHVMAARFEECNLSLRVVASFLVNYVRHCLLARSSADYAPKGRGGRVYNMYLLAYIQAVHPKVVITFIEDSPDFHALARLHRQAEFIAVQNGSKYSVMNSVFQPSKRLPNTGKELLFFCFGQREADLFASIAPHVAFYPVGSLLASYYRHAVAIGEEEPLHDICLVSSRKASILRMARGELAHAARGLARLDEFLRRHLGESETVVRLCVACRATEPADIAEEREHYRKMFGGLQNVELTLVEYDRENFSTYQAMSHSRVVVTLYSSTGVEAFGWGRRALLCMFYALECRRDLPEGDWRLYEPDYNEFSRRLDEALSVSRDDYVRQNRETMRYMMRDDPGRPAYAAIRLCVTQALERYSREGAAWSM